MASSERGGPSKKKRKIPSLVKTRGVPTKKRKDQSKKIREEKLRDPGRAQEGTAKRKQKQTLKKNSPLHAFRKEKKKKTRPSPDSPGRKIVP